jgi:S-adenosylmethionine-diacylglycerol 3-amino-3-carboxypropyl transferase
MERLTLFHGTVQEAAAKQGHGGFDGYNLSDIFEYLSSEQCEAIYRTLLQQANPGARFAYWNMLVPRRLSENLSDQVRFLEEESLRLFRRDRAFFYSRFIIEEVQP